jgi:hypothetical protein
MRSMVSFVANASRDWKAWIAVGIISMLISISVRMSAEVFAGDKQKIMDSTARIEALETQVASHEKRILSLETGASMATADRFTGTDHARFKAEVEERLAIIREGKCSK